MRTNLTHCILAGLGLALASQAQAATVTGNITSTLTLIAAAGLLAIYLVNAALMAIVIYWGHKLGINIETSMRAKAFEHLESIVWANGVVCPHCGVDLTKTGK